MSDGAGDMKIDPSRAKALSSQLQAVSERIGKVAGGRNVSRSPDPKFGKLAGSKGERLIRKG